MKKVCIILFLSILSHFKTFSQDQEETFSKSDVLYDVHLPLLVIKCLDAKGKLPNDTILVNIPKDRRFYVVEYLETGDALIQFWCDNYDKPTLFDSIVVWANEENRLLRISNTYLIKRSDLNNRTRRRYSTSFITRSYNRPFSGTSITGGVTVMPFKFRPRVKMDNEKGGFEFSKDIQLGLTGGIKQRMNHYNPYYLNVLINVGISSVTMDSYNTLGKITNSTDIAALTFAYGVVLDFSKIQLGIFAGTDHVSDRNRNDWIYQGKLWWSVGFGYSIFSVSTKPIGN